MASSSSQQKNQGSKAFFELESDSTRRKVCESSRLFDVFINHRGPDVKQTLAAQLYNSLQEVGIRAFLDSEEKELGVSFPSTIETAIKSAKVHIAIFSKRYAESAWCLAELDLMLQSQAKIIPVFYEVQPWELRYIENGEYAKAFTEHENKQRYLEKLPEWKKALQSLSFVAGEEFKGDCINIIASVQKEIQKKTCLHVATYPVGLDNLVEDFEGRYLKELVLDFENQCGLEEGKHKAKVVGIFGMGGAGKTTLAKELFNRNCSKYSRISFLFDVREASERRQLPYLQLKLINDLFQDHSLSFISTEEGTRYLKDRLQRSSPFSSFLIVIDDIDHVEQLNALMIMDIFNKFDNTLVIVTTRDVGVLINAGITSGYHLKGMDRDNGRELFCWHAFEKPYSSSGYEVLVEDFVDVCGGLPLSLRVLARHVHGKPHSFWRSALVEAKRRLARDVQQTLRISFDALGDQEKQVFMDIACFFVGRLKSIAEIVWEGSGWNAQYALETLKDKCLVEEIEIVSLNEALHVHKEVELRMHDHLRDLGREMASELSTPLRVWRRQDLEYLESMGFTNILAKTDVRCFHSIFDESISCQVTFFLGQPDICVVRSASLLWLELDFKSTEQTSIPSLISRQYVHCLKIKRGRLKTLWENRMQAPSQLKELHIYETFLEKVPDMSWLSHNLGKVVLDAHGWPIQGLSLLESLNMNLCGLSLRSSTLKGVQASTKTEEGITCESLVIWNFKFSREVAWNNRGMFSNVRAPMGGLENLEISGEELVSKILISGIHYPSLESIKLNCMENLTEVVLIGTKTLNRLDITNCKYLRSVSGICKLEKLVLLNISECPQLEELSLGRVSCLGRITIVDCKHLKSVSGLGDLVELNDNDFTELVTSDHFSSLSGVLNISECPELEELRLAQRSCVKKIVIENCNHLKSLTGILNLENLVLLNISHCSELEELSLGHLNCLEAITLLDCKHLKSVPEVSSYKMLVKLYISQCPEFEELRFAHLSCLEEIVIEKCSHLRSVSGMSNLEKLVLLNISHLPQLEELRLAQLSCLEKIAIENCEHLRSVSGINNLAKLVELEIFHCEKLKFECLCLSGMQRLERIILGSNVKVKFIELDGCQILNTMRFGYEKLVKLSIRNCPEFDKLPNFSYPGCLESIIVDGCGKFEDLILHSCRSLKSVSGNLELRRLYIHHCPELEELPNLSSLSCVENIEIKDCEKLKNIMLPTSLASLHVESCSDLQRVSTTDDLTMLTELYINRCPKLEELPSFSSLSCVKKIYINFCRKLKNIMLPTSLASLHVESCSDLQRVSTTDDLTMLKELYIIKCPELEELPSFSSLSFVEEINIQSCGKLKLENIILPTSLTSLRLKSCRALQRLSTIDVTKLAKLYINECSELKELPSFSGLSCVKTINIQSCGKLQNIVLPTSLASLHVEGCSDLQRVSTTDDLTMLTELYINECPELEELPSFSSLSCVEEINIQSCGKLKLENIILPTSLTSLRLKSCRALQRLSTIDVTKLTKLYINECSELKELPSFSGLSCVKTINIQSCGKLQNIVLPTSLASLHVESCSDLQRVSTTDDLTMLTELYIKECPELEELPNFSSLSCMEDIYFKSCGKLKLENIILPKSLTSLGLESCRELQMLSTSDVTKLTKLYINECPELKELSSFSGLSCIETINIQSCGKLQNIVLPTSLASLHVESCSDLQRVSTTDDLTMLKELYISKCPELEELPSFSSLSFVEEINIQSCGKLKLENIILPTILTSLGLESCRELQRLSTSDVTKLTKLYINECPELLEELSSFCGLSYIETINIQSCGKLQNIVLPTSLDSLHVESCSDLQKVSTTVDLTMLTELYINECPELKELPSFSSLSCVEEINIQSCGKLKLENIILPTSLTSLRLKSCRALQRLSTIDVTKLTKLYINECSELKELPSFSSLSCVKTINIQSCGKLQNIVLPTSLASLHVEGCSDLRKVSTTDDLTMLTELYINECPELEELPSFSSLSCVKEIYINSCGKLENIMLPTRLFLKEIKNMRLSYCSNAVIRNCIDQLKSVPLECVVIGRAVDGAESSLNENLFSEVDTVTDIVKFGVEHTYEKWEGLIEIFCCVVVVDSSSSLQDINTSLSRQYVSDIDMRQGEWIITMVGLYFMRGISEVLKSHGIMKKGLQIGVRKGEGWKSMKVLHTIADRLYRL